MNVVFNQLKLFSWTVLAETRNSKILFSIAIIYIAGFSLSLFISEISIAESKEAQIASCAAFFRLAIIFFLALFCINSIVRDINDRMLLLYLSLPISRSVFVLGKFFGFACLGLILSVIAALIFSIYAEFSLVWQWACSLWFECLIVTGFSLLCAFSFGQITSAFSAVAGIYFLSRSISAILMMANNPLRPLEETVSNQFADILLKILDYLLPGLDRFTRTEWLVYGKISSSEFNVVIQQTAIYLVLLLSIACFDFYRKNI